MGARVMPGSREDLYHSPRPRWQEETPASSGHSMSQGATTFLRPLRCSRASPGTTDQRDTEDREGVSSGDIPAGCPNAGRREIPVLPLVFHISPSTAVQHGFPSSIGGCPPALCTRGAVPVGRAEAADPIPSRGAVAPRAIGEGARAPGGRSCPGVGAVRFRNVQALLDQWAGVWAAAGITGRAAVIWVLGCEVTIPPALL